VREFLVDDVETPHPHHAQPGSAFARTERGGHHRHLVLLAPANLLEPVVDLFLIWFTANAPTRSMRPVVGVFF
jgi:hypothetical protein